MLRIICYLALDIYGLSMPGDKTILSRLRRFVVRHRVVIL